MQSQNVKILSSELVVWEKPWALYGRLMGLASIQTDTGVFQNKKETPTILTKIIFLKRWGLQGTMCFLGKHLKKLIKNFEFVTTLKILTKRQKIKTQ